MTIDATDLIATTYPDETGWLERHGEEARKYADHITIAANIAGVPQAIIVAIGSRESGWGLLLSPPGPEGTGDGGHGRGLMQIDDRWHRSFVDSGAWKIPHDNLVYGARVLHDSIFYIRSQFTALAPFAAMAAGIAGYNAGPGNARKAILEGGPVDKYTANGDYSQDVLNRAGWLQRHGWTQ